MSQYLHPDLTATPAQGAPIAANPPPGATFAIPLGDVTLTELVHSERFAEVDRHEAYLGAVQDFAKKYDWDGNLISDGQAPIQPGWVVPLALRRPCARWDLPKVINSRYTALLFGADRFPELTVPDDPDAEEYIKGLAEASRLPLRMIAARRLGGAGGAVGTSFAFVDGKPRIEVHSAKHLTVLDWRDRAEWRVGAVLKAYCYPRRVFDPNSGKMVMVDFYYARLWTETDEIEWEPIPSAVAKSKDWSLGPKRVTQHGLGFCPFYWAQNLPNDEDEVGLSDYNGLHDNFDEINRLVSAQVRAVKANADPTFVVKIDPAYNDGDIRKGQGAAVFSPGGAEYAVLPPHTVKAIEDTLAMMRRATLDMASVVDAEPEKLSGQAMSAQAMRILYAPMTAQADVLREQYGEGLIKPLLLGMLRAARSLQGQVQVELDADGNEVQVQHTVQLPPRTVQNEDGSIQLLDRIPGESDQLTLNWNPYFSPTWADIKSATEAAQLANGGKPLISQRTSVASVQSLYGVSSVDKELDAIQAEAKEAMKAAQEAMGVGPTPAGEDGKGPPPFGGKAGEDDGEEDPDEEADKPLAGAAAGAAAVAAAVAGKD